MSGNYSYTNINDIYTLTGIKPSFFKFDKNDNPEELLDNLINSWIKKSSNIINEYCKTSFNDPVPDIISLSCNLLVINLINISQNQRDAGIHTKDDWKANLRDNSYFTKEVRELLKPYKKNKKTCIELDIIRD